MNSSQVLLKTRFLAKTNKKKANSFINNNPYLHPINHTNPLHVLHEGMTEINDLTKKNTHCQENYDKMSEETSGFQSCYSLIQKNKRNIKDKKNIEPNPFIGLINLYKRKGYKIPDLSINNNLFNPSVLLTEINQIQGFYEYYKNLAQTQDKGALYLDKLDQYIKKLKAEESNNKGKRLMKDYNKKSSIFRMNMLQPDAKETKKENKELIEYNKTLETFITTALDDIDSIGLKVPKTTKNKNKQGAQAKFRFTHKNSSPIGPSAFIFNTPNPSNEPISQFNNFVNESKKKSKFNTKHFFQTPSVFTESVDEPTMPTTQKPIESTHFSIDSPEISRIEKIPFRKAQTKKIILGKLPEIKKVNKTILDIQSQIFIDDGTKKLIKSGDPSAYLKLIQNKIQYKANRYDYEPIKRMRMASYHNRATDNKYERIYNTIDAIKRLDKALIKATNQNTE